MALFSDADPLYGSNGLCATQASAIVSMQWSTRDGILDDSEDDDVPAALQEHSAAEASVRYSYELTRRQLAEQKQQQHDICEEERYGEKDCLICSFGKLYGNVESFQTVLDFYEANKHALDTEKLCNDACDLYMQKVYNPRYARKRERCGIPRLKPRHFRRHHMRNGGCGNDLMRKTEQLGLKLYSIINAKLDLGMRVDQKTGIKEIVTPDTHRALQSYFTCVRLACSGGSNSSSSGNNATTTVNVSSKRGVSNTSVSVSALTGQDRAKRQKRLDSYTLSKYS